MRKMLESETMDSPQSLVTAGGVAEAGSQVKIFG